MNDPLKNIDHAHILAKRIQMEMNSGNIDNALYLTDTFIFLFSRHKTAINNLIESYTTLSGKLINDGQIDQAESLISKALLLSPENSQLLSLLVKTKRIQRNILRSLGRPSIKEIAHKFIERHIPEELSIFDVAWRVFNDIRPKDFKHAPITEALGLVGPTNGDIKSPQIIILLNMLTKKGEQIFTFDNARKTLNEIGREIGCSSDLVDKIIQFISEEYL